MIGTTYVTEGSSLSSITTVSTASQASSLNSDIALSTEHANVIQLFEAGLLQDAEIDLLLNTNDVIEPNDLLETDQDVVPDKLIDLKFFYNNVCNNRERVHALLASSKYDVLALVDTPWYQIGANRLLSNKSGHAVFGTVNNSEYQYYHPTGHRQARRESTCRNLH